MSEIKKPTLEEIKAYAEQEGIELTDDMLSEIAGGAYSDEAWQKLIAETEAGTGILDRTSMMQKLLFKKPCIGMNAEPNFF